MGHFLAHREIKKKIDQKRFRKKKNDFWMGHFLTHREIKKKIDQKVFLEKKTISGWATF